MTEDQNGSDPWASWRARISAALRRVEDRSSSWQENIDKRAKSPVKGASNATDISVNQDWPLTKAKIAQLYSQTPEVRLTLRTGMEPFQPALELFARELNDTLADINIGATTEEVLSDVINAAGIGGVIVTCDKRTKQTQVPEVDPSTLPPDVQASIANGEFEMPMVPVTVVADIQYRVDRISPVDLLIPSDFTGSDYDKAPWLGRRGRMTWAQAKAALGLTEEEKDDVLGTDARANQPTRTLNTDSTKFKDTDVVNYSELFYWRHLYHEDETNFHALHRLVFVDGLDDPKIDEPYRVQVRTPEGRLVGVKKNPIRISTLTYISDECLPPSDSSIARYQVTELEESRRDMRLQRKHSIPIRWYNPNMVSPGTRTLLERGDYQGFVPIPNGERGIGEVARAAFPPEKFEFDKVIKDEITEIWQVGTNQAGAFASGERSAREAGIVEKNFQRRVGQEQDKVQKFFLGIAEVLAGHLAIYGTFNVPDNLGPMRQQFADAFKFTVDVDSTVRKDADEQIEKLVKGLNITAQSGYVNPKLAISKIWTLLGEDASQIVIDPQPKAPEPVKVSVSKAEDLVNPLFLATLLHTGQAPGPDEVAAAIKMLSMAMAGGVPLLPPEKPAGPPGETEKPAGVNHDWSTPGRIDKRTEDGGA